MRILGWDMNNYFEYESDDISICEWHSGHHQEGGAGKPHKFYSFGIIRVIGLSNILTNNVN